MHRTTLSRLRINAVTSRTIVDARTSQARHFAQWKGRPSLDARSATRASVQLVQQRFASDGLKKEVKKAWRQHRIVFAALVLGIGFATVSIAQSIYQYFQLYSLSNYPKPVQEKLRRAIYYKIIDFKPQDSIQYLKEALIAANECGLDPYSDEVIGIRIQAVEVMEKAEAYKEAIRALEHMKAANIGVYSKLEGSTTLDDQAKRTRVLLWSVRFAVKLGELYGRPEIWDRKAAEANFEWATTTVLQESQRRVASNITDDKEGPWMSNEELGATMEKLATTYESQNLYYLAAPLYLHAINLRTVSDCHTVVLMNNLASCLSQQTPQAASAVRSVLDASSVDKRPDEPLTRSMLLDSAATWAQNALSTAGRIKPPARDEECDMGCAVALHNLGEIAEMKKEFDLATKWYTEAISLSRAIGFQEGAEHSAERLAKVKAVPG